MLDTGRSPRSIALGFLQTPPRGDALALSLAFGSAATWQEDFHLPRFVPCPAHTLLVQRRAAQRTVRRNRLLAGAAMPVIMAFPPLLSVVGNL